MAFIYDTTHVTWALRDFIQSDVCVVDSFKILFDYFLLYKNPKKVLTDINLSKISCDEFIKNSFEIEKDIEPDYFWIIKDNYYEREVARLQFKESGESKVKFKNKMLKTALQCYDAGKRRLLWKKP